MKFKFTLLFVFILFSLTPIFSRGGDIGAGKGGSTGGLGIYERMFFSGSLIKVQIIDLTTDLEVAIVSEEELGDVTENLPNGEYLLIYTDSNGSVTDEILLLKE